MWASSQTQRQNLGMPRLRLYGPPRSRWLDQYAYPCVRYPSEVSSFLHVSPSWQPQQEESGRHAPKLSWSTNGFNHVSWIRSLRRQATPLALLRSPSLSRG